MSLTAVEEARFQSLLAEVDDPATSGRMRDFIQHGSVTTYDHTRRVAHTAFALAIRAERRGAQIDERALVRGAFLHDYFLYDWHVKGPEDADRHHATRHPLYAAANADRDFGLTPKERNIIESHMWPLPPGPSNRVPHSTEACLVCIADKWCSLVETVAKR